MVNSLHGKIQKSYRTGNSFDTWIQTIIVSQYELKFNINIYHHQLLRRYLIYKHKTTTSVSYFAHIRNNYVFLIRWRRRETKLKLSLHEHVLFGKLWTARVNGSPSNFIIASFCYNASFSTSIIAKEIFVMFPNALCVILLARVLYTC